MDPLPVYDTGVLPTLNLLKPKHSGEIPETEVSPAADQETRTEEVRVIEEGPETAGEPAVTQEASPDEERNVQERPELRERPQAEIDRTAIQEAKPDEEPKTKEASKIAEETAATQEAKTNEESKTERGSKLEEELTTEEPVSNNESQSKAQELDLESEVQSQLAEPLELEEESKPAEPSNSNQLSKTEGGSQPAEKSKPETEPDMDTKSAQIPSLTKTWHDGPYPAIDPTRSELSAKDKVVAITGGGGAIGGAIALAFAQAGAKVAVLSKNTKFLHGTKEKVEQEVSGREVLCVHANIGNADSLRGALGNVKKELGDIWCLVANAGYLPEMKTLADADEEEWWQGFETNARGASHNARAFPSVAAKDAILVDISAGVVHLPAMPNASGYITSKLAATKIYESFGRENPSTSVIHIHPGAAKSEQQLKTGLPDDNDDIDDDEQGAARPAPIRKTLSEGKMKLPGQFVVWAVSEEANAFRGKFLWCNWDVKELLASEHEFGKEGVLGIGLSGKNGELQA